MRINSIFLNKFRCFESEEVKLGPITVFTGPNNSGKSSVLRAILLCQLGTQATASDVRVGATRADVVLKCEQVENIPNLALHRPVDVDISISLAADSEHIKLLDERRRVNVFGGEREIGQFSNTEPNNCLVPYLSKRKVFSYSEDVRFQNARTVTEMTYLAAKLARITNVSFPGHDLYRKTCEDILGFMLTVVPSENGQRPGIFLPDGTILTLSVQFRVIMSLVVAGLYFVRRLCWAS